MKTKTRCPQCKMLYWKKHKCQIICRARTLEEFKEESYADGFADGHSKAFKEVLDFIENQRDNGNWLDGSVAQKGFSAGICLSELLKLLRSKDG